MKKFTAKKTRAPIDAAARASTKAKKRSGIESRNPIITAFVDNRAATTVQRELAKNINNGPQVAQQRQLNHIAGSGGPMTTQLMNIVRNEPLPGEFTTTQRQGVEEEDLMQGQFVAAQRQPADNNTGLPGNLKSGIESLSGLSMDDVTVHYNSSQPAQLNALAYAQGRDIHIAAGQEQHLPHEAWHVVQQAQGRVKPTMQMADGVPVNDSRALEKEADTMGARALRTK